MLTVTARTASGLVAIALVGLTACSDVSSPVGPVIRSVAIDSATGSIFRSLDVTLGNPGRVQVEYWSAGTPRLRVRRDTAAAKHHVFIPRLRANTTYSFEVRASPETGDPGQATTGTFTTGALPAELAEIQFEATGTPTNAITMLELVGSIRNERFYSGPVAVDASGAVVWFRSLPEPVVTTGMVRRRNGNYAMNELDFSTNTQLGITEIRPDLSVVRRLPATATIKPHHDIIETPRNTLLFIGQETAKSDDSTVVGESLWEWSDDGAAIKRWSSFDFLDYMADRAPRGSANDWLHANSVRLGPRGNVILSFQTINQLISISPDFKSIEWRVGGPNATYVMSASTAFDGQHTGQEIATNHLLMFDNGFDRFATTRMSRAIELSMDPVTKTVSMVWQFRAPDATYAPIVGSVWRLANGNTVVTYGTTGNPVLANQGGSGPVEVYEVSPAGVVVWKLTVRHERLVLVYRGTPYPNLADETVVSTP